MNAERKKIFICRNERVSYLIDGAELRKARKELKMTLMELGKIIHCSAAFLSDLEHGRKTTLTMHRAQKLAELFGVQL